MTVASWCCDIKPTIELFAWSFITQHPLHSLRVQIKLKKKTERVSWLQRKRAPKSSHHSVIIHTLLFSLVAMLKCCGTWRVVHRLWQSWFISRLINSLFVFINLKPIWAYSSRHGGRRSAKHRDQHREPVSLSGITIQTPRGASITRRQTISLPLLSSALILFSKAHRCTILSSRIKQLWSVRHM